MALALIVSFLFLLLVLLGDNEFSFVVLGLSSLLLLIFSPKLIDSEKIKQFFANKKFRLLFLLIVSFLFLATISLFYTANLPLSIERLIDLYFSFAVFFLFLLMKEKYLAEKYSIDIFNLLIFVLSLLVLTLIIFPGLANYLPGMNMLFATYGHNHFAALLLLVMPFFWWQFFKTRKKSIFFLIIFFYLLIFLSLARIVILLTILQFLVLLLVNGEGFMSLKKNDRKILLIPLILLSVFLLAMIALSFPKTFKVESICQFQSGKLCKDFSYEGRRGYWQSALEIFKSSPVFGTGLNSYAVLNRQHLHYGASLSSYAHNEFLQAFSDLGILGGSVFLFLFVYIFYLGIKKEKNKKHFSLELSLLIGVFFIFLNSLFDFDWQFLAIFVLSLVFLAIVLRDSLISGFKINKRKNNNKLFYYFHFILNSFVFLFFSLNLTNRILLIFAKNNLAFNTYPFSRHQMIDFARDPKLSESNKKRLWIIHHNDNYFLNNVLEIETDFKRKQEIWQDLINLHPLVIGSERFSDFIEESIENKEDYLLIRDLIFSATNWLALEINDGYSIDEEIKENIGNLLLLWIDLAYQYGDLKGVGEAYYQYSRILDYLPMEHYPQFLSLKPSADLLQLLIGLQDFNPQLFRDENILFGQFYLQVVEEVLKNGQDELAYEFYRQIINPSSPNDIIYFGEISDFLLKEQLNNLQNKDFSLIRLNYFLNFYFATQDFYWNFYLKRDLARELIRQANEIYFTDQELSFNYYFLAHALNEWSLTKSDNYLSNFTNEEFLEGDSYQIGLNYFLNQLDKEDFIFQVGFDFYQTLENYHFHK